MLHGKLIAFHGAGLELEEQVQVVPELRKGEVLVKNRYTTLCGSDLHTYCGIRQEPCPTVLGHEIVGEIVAFYDGDKISDADGNLLSTGDLVTWTVFAGNPESVFYHEGMPQKSEPLYKYGHRLIAEDDIFHGGLSTYCLLKPGTAVLKIPADMPLSVAAPINCAISTIVGAIRVAGPLKGKNVLITGLGLLGMACAAMCREDGANLIVATDISEQRLERAHMFGVDIVLNSGKHGIGDFSRIVKETVPEQDIHVAFDMSGAPDAMELGINLLGIGGTAVWIGAVFKQRALAINAERVIRNILSIKGLHNYNYEDFRNAVRFMETSWRKYPFDQVVEKEFAWHETKQAFDYALEYKPLRVGIRINP